MSFFQKLILNIIVSITLSFSFSDIICAADRQVKKNQNPASVEWASSYVGQTCTRALTVEALDGTMVEVNYPSNPDAGGSVWTGSYTGPEASFSGGQKQSAQAGVYTPTLGGKVQMYGSIGYGAGDNTYSWSVATKYEIKDVKVKKIYVNGQDFTDGQITVLIGTTHQFFATPDPDNATWPVDKPVWNVINSSGNFVIGATTNVTFPNEGTCTITATCTNSKSVTVKVVKPEVYSVGFSGNGQITLKKNNPDNDIYQNNGDTTITNPVWIKNTKNDPVAFKMNVKPTVTVGLRLTDKLSFAGTGTFKGTLAGTNITATQNFTFPANVENASTSVVMNNFVTTELYITKAGEATLNWEIKSEENNWVSLDSTKHEWYITYDNTINTTTLKRINWATSKANGATTITTAADVVAQKLSQNPGYIPVGTGLSSDQNAWRFLDMGKSGDCATLSKLSVTCLGVLGVPAEGPKYSYATNHACPIPQGNPNQLTHVNSDTCKNLCTRIFNFTHSCGNVLAVPQKLMYTDNNYEAFFTVNNPTIKAFTVYPYGGPFSNPNYYYLEVLKSVSGSAEQYWFNNTSITPHPTDPDLPGTPMIACCPFCQSKYPEKHYLYKLPFRLDNSTVPYPAIPDNNDTCVE